MTEVLSPAGEQVLCNTCAKSIPAAAKKCTECDSYQDWRRMFGLTTPVLSLLVALVAVLSAAAPTAATFLTPKNSKIEAGIHDARSERLIVYATNSGVRPGAIVFGSVIIWVDRRPIAQFYFAPEGSSERAEIAPGRSAFVPMAASEVVVQGMSPADVEQLHLRLTKPAPKTRCESNVTIQNFDGEMEVLSATIPCAYIFDTVSGAAKRKVIYS
jgi:hypothetical protein